MYSFGWPDMLRSTTARLIKDKDAIRSNLRLLLNSERLSLFGDPYFGIQLKQFIFEQNNAVVVDLLVDEIFTTILQFLPQLFVRRSDITVYSDKSNLFAQIKATYKLDNTSDLYVINLTSESFEGE